MLVDFSTIVGSDKSRLSEEVVGATGNFETKSDRFDKEFLGAWCFIICRQDFDEEAVVRGCNFEDEVVGKSRLKQAGIKAIRFGEELLGAREFVVGRRVFEDEVSAKSRL